MTSQNQKFKKYLLITLEYPPEKGGIANYLWEISQAFNPGQFFVLTHKVRKEQIEENEVVRENLFYRFIWPKWLKVFNLAKKIIFKEKIDCLITSHVIPVGYVCFLMKKFFNIPYIVILHGHDILACTRNAWKQSWFLTIIKQADKIIYNSQFTKNLMQKQELSVPQFILKPAPNLRSENFEITDEQIKKFKDKYNLHNKKVLLTVCRLEQRKGIDSIIKIMPKLLSQIPDLIYFVVGGGDDQNRLEKLIKENQLEKNVILAGRLSDNETALVYKICDLFALPSRQVGKSIEGFGIVFLEAGSFGKPVIGGNSGGVAEAVLDNKTGLLVNPFNLDDIYDKVLLVLNDSELSQRLGQAGRERVEKEYSKGQRKYEILNIFNG